MDYDIAPSFTIERANVPTPLSREVDEDSDEWATKLELTEIIAQHYKRYVCEEPYTVLHHAFFFLLSVDTLRDLSNDPDKVFRICGVIEPFIISMVTGDAETMRQFLADRESFHHEPYQGPFKVQPKLKVQLAEKLPSKPSGSGLIAGMLKWFGLNRTRGKPPVAEEISQHTCPDLFHLIPRIKGYYAGRCVITGRMGGTSCADIIPDALICTRENADGLEPFSELMSVLFGATFSGQLISLVSRNRSAWNHLLLSTSLREQMRSGYCAFRPIRIITEPSSVHPSVPAFFVHFSIHWFEKNKNSRPWLPFPPCLVSLWGLFLDPSKVFASDRTRYMERDIITGKLIEDGDCFSIKCRSQQYAEHMFDAMLARWAAGVIFYFAGGVGQLDDPSYPYNTDEVQQEDVDEEETRQLGRFAARVLATGSLV